MVLSKSMDLDGISTAHSLWTVRVAERSNNKNTNREKKWMQSDLHSRQYRKCVTRMQKVYTHKKVHTKD